MAMNINAYTAVRATEIAMANSMILNHWRQDIRHMIPPFGVPRNAYQRMVDLQISQRVKKDVAAN
jgi:hypothetical protein